MNLKKTIDISVSATLIVGLITFIAYLILSDIYVRYKSALIGILMLYVVWRAMRLYTLIKNFKKEEYED